MAMMMKKITLASIILFAIFWGVILLVSRWSDREQAKVTNATPVNQSSIAVNQQHNNVTPSSIRHINSPNIDISKLNFDENNHIKDTFTLDEAAKHSSQHDCYLIINNKVYDVSSYVSYHPGGSRTITSRCGKEVTGIFASIHSNRAWDLLKKYQIGTVTASKPDTMPQVLAAVSEALKKANPNAEIVKVRPKAGFYVAKIIYDGKLYEVHINNQGKIFKEEIENDESDWSLWENDKDDK